MPAGIECPWAINSWPEIDGFHLKGDFRMKRYFALALSLLAPLSTAQAQDSSSVWDVSMCVGCNSNEQFNAAARQVAGTAFNGEREILVINPQTNDSRFVTVVQLDDTPPGAIPYSVPLNSDFSDRGTLPSKGRTRTLVRLGSGTALFTDNYSNIVFADELSQTDLQTASYFAHGRVATAEERVEIGAILQFGEGNFVITLPRRDYFSSFTRREPAAVGNEIFRAMTDYNVGWAGRTISNRIKSLIKKRFEHYTGRSFQVCAIFNNGDSACFNPDAATPSLEHLVEGSAKTKDGTPIGGSGSGGGGGLEVSNRYSPNGAWGSAGSDGGSGELWLFCSFIGGKIQTCWTEELR